ncbi:hypothetical protein LCGC14_1042410 [marine sediment metagenome]|uniref:Uncharacterized protein n=1 Tax=marine sediment metagenome TaxID=412755 RepID=A0A0F9MRC7_9ZZZZ
MRFYHTTTFDRVESILEKGLLPNSRPTWFDIPSPYVMLSILPWRDLNGQQSVVLEVDLDVSVPVGKQIKNELRDSSEGLRWPYPILPSQIKELAINKTDNRHNQ